ncbi:MAG: DUF4169 family protein [Alphaproteobacteria bacterium]|jgi:hypothetical protein|nr:DUF4169 family protein [Alphaproteobacteria bacterium]
MTQIVNLRRARKAKTRAEVAAQADANRIKHGLSKHERALAKARKDNQNRIADAHFLKDNGA